MWSTRSSCVGRAGRPAVLRGLLVSVACSAASSAWGTSAWLSRPSHLLCQPLRGWKFHPGTENVYLWGHKLASSQRGRWWEQRRDAGDTIQPPKWSRTGVACTKWGEWWLETSLVSAILCLCLLSFYLLERVCAWPVVSLSTKVAVKVRLHLIELCR